MPQRLQRKESFQRWSIISFRKISPVDEELKSLDVIVGKDSGETVSGDADWLVAILEENNVEPLDGISFKLAEVLS